MYKHILEYEKEIQETKKLIIEVAFTNAKNSKTGQVRQSMSHGKKSILYEIDYSHQHIERLKELLNFLYHDQGIGFKLLSNLLDKQVSYSQLRRIFFALGVERRHGTACITESLKKLRSQNAIEKGTWRNWPEKNPTKDKNTKRYLGGWFLNKSTKKYVWLRSSWEFGYARWLNENGVKWDYEVSSYLLSNGTYYRPDFFIYECDALCKVIEIKSTWNHGTMDRINKFYQFRLEYPHINAELVTNDLFDTINVPYDKVLHEWKKVRKLEQP